jgi:hypothetical protein
LPPTHCQIRRIIGTAGMTMSSAVVMLGDLEPKESLHLIVAPLVERALPVCFVHGNHDADGFAFEPGLNCPTTRWTIDDLAVARQKGEPSFKSRAA